MDRTRAAEIALKRMTVPLWFPTLDRYFPVVNGDKVEMSPVGARRPCNNPARSAPLTIPFNARSRGCRDEGHAVTGTPRQGCCHLRYFCVRGGTKRAAGDGAEKRELAFTQPGSCGKPVFDHPSDHYVAREIVDAEMVVSNRLH